MTTTTTTTVRRNVAHNTPLLGSRKVVMISSWTVDQDRICVPECGAAIKISTEWWTQFRFIGSKPINLLCQQTVMCHLVDAVFGWVKGYQLTTQARSPFFLRKDEVTKNSVLKTQSILSVCSGMGVHHSYRATMIFLTLNVIHHVGLALEWAIAIVYSGWPD